MPRKAPASVAREQAIALVKSLRVDGLRADILGGLPHRENPCIIIGSPLHHGCRAIVYVAPEDGRLPKRADDWYFWWPLQQPSRLAQIGPAMEIENAAKTIKEVLAACR